jgi:hypothetical protein
MFEEAKAVPVPSDAHAVPTEIDIKEVRARCADLLRRAILTMAATPDPERRFLAGYKSGMPEPNMSPSDRQAAFGLDAVIEAAKEAREVQALRASRFKPTMQDVDRCLDVLAWLTWLGYRNDGGKEVQDHHRMGPRRADVEAGAALRPIRRHGAAMARRRGGRDRAEVPGRDRGDDVAGGKGSVAFRHP